MLDIIFEEDFHKDMKDLDKTIRKEIQNQLLKIRVEGISRKHFHYGLPYFIERVGYSCRIIYQINDNKIYILRFLKSHKEYEKWYKKEQALLGKAIERDLEEIKQGKSKLYSKKEF